MIIVDSGFIHALADKRDDWHAAATRQIGTLDEGWASTWPVVTEASCLLNKRLGTRDASAFLDDIAAGGVRRWDLPHPVHRPARLRR